MRIKLVLLSLVGSASLRRRRDGRQRPGASSCFTFQGQLTATPSNGGVSITVQGGNKRRAARDARRSPSRRRSRTARRPSSSSGRTGIPTVVQPGDLAAGDYVTVNVRAPRGSDLAAIEQQAAGIVGDHGTQLYKPDKPLYLFRGTLTSVGSSSVTVHVTGGDRRALRPADRQLERPVVHVRRRHDLPALAGQGADRDRRLEARRRRQDRRPHPRRARARRSRRSSRRPRTTSATGSRQREVADLVPGTASARCRAPLLAFTEALRDRHEGDEDMTMNRRRFLFLATALVAVNSFFWLAQSGFALPRAIINQFFGGNMIRAEVLIVDPGAARRTGGSTAASSPPSPARP